jgi:hypothetical protein
VNAARKEPQVVLLTPVSRHLGPCGQRAAFGPALRSRDAFAPRAEGSRGCRRG